MKRPLRPQKFKDRALSLKYSSSVANSLVDTQIYQFSNSGLRRKSINPIVTIPF